MDPLFDRPCWKYVDGSWRELTETPKPTHPTLKPKDEDLLSILTYNVLFNKYETESIHTLDRYPHLLRLLEQSDAHIIGLQEVEKPFLALLLASPFIQSTYYLSDATSSTVDPYGQLLLSAFPFTTHHFPFSTHKRVIIGRVSVRDTTWLIPVIHLTSEQHKGESNKRLKQMAYINQLASKHPAEECVYIGDFNMGDGHEDESSCLPSDFVDCWKLLRPLDAGYTFDPATNVLAKINSSKQISWRYDRVLVRNPTRAKPIIISQIGRESFTVTDQKANQIQICPSDHYGVKCVFALSAHKVSCVEKVSSLLDQYAALPNPNFGLLGPHLQTLGIFETTESTQIRNRALQLVEKAIQIGWHVPQDFILQSFGSYSLEVHTKNSDIDLLVVGNLPRKDFFNHVSKTFKSTADVQFLRLVKDAMVPIIKLIVLDIPIDLIYAQVHNSLKKKQISWTKLNLSDMDIPDARALSGYIDCITIKNLIPNIDKWRVLFQAVKYWAKKKGIYGNKLCYLGGFGWMILTTRICQMLPNASVENLFYNFFKFYASWDWSKVPLTVLINAKPIEFNMGPGDCFVVVTVTSPHRNSARNVTQSTKKIIINEFQNAANYLENNQFAKIWEPVPFFSKYPSYLEIVCEAENLKDFLKWIGYLESRFVSLITEMEQVTKNRLITHIYPASFQSLETIQHPHSCTFFIGLEVIPDPNGEQARFSINEPIEKFQLLCYGWEGFSKSMLIQIKRTKREKIQNLNMKVVQVELLKVKAAPVQSDLAPSPSPSPSPSDATGAKKKFRTVEEVYNRIKSDPSLDPDCFVIGYEDRFVGVKEIDFREFRTKEGTDSLKFIPFHRVVYYKRNGTIVWDKTKRIDLL